MSLYDNLTRLTGSALKLIKVVSSSVNAVVTVTVIALAWWEVIPAWVAMLIWIASLFLSGYVALLILRLVLGASGFEMLTVMAQAERYDHDYERRNK
jgi:hypothetical protein